MTLSILTTSCGSVTIKDTQFCGDLGEQGAHCNQVYTKNPVDIAKDEWDAKRFGMICTDAEGFENWKTAIQSLCDKTKMCNYEVKKKLQIAIENLDDVKRATEASIKNEPTGHLPKTKFDY